MGLSVEDKLFCYLEAGKTPAHGKFSLIYSGPDFYGNMQYINGYVMAVTSLYNAYVSAGADRIDVLDSLVYPLCFNYRHVVELYIKYFYLKYSNAVEKDIIKNVSHNLTRAWGKTKPCVEVLLRKIESKLDLSLIDKFVSEIELFDRDSSLMRFPYKIDLSPVHATSVRLDIIHLHEKMMGLYEYFRRIDDAIDTVLINNTCEQSFEERIRINYKASVSDIAKTIELLKRLISEETTETHSLERRIIRLADIDDTDPWTKNRVELYSHISNIKHVNAAMIALLTHVGMDIDYHRVSLATTGAEKKKDFFKLMELTLAECGFISFETSVNNTAMCYALLEKKPELPLKWLSIAKLNIEEVLL